VTAADAGAVPEQPIVFRDRRNSLRLSAAANDTMQRSSRADSE